MNGSSDKEKVRQEFAARFRRALAEAGISPNEQTRLQKLFGVTGQAVRKWADGTSMPTSARLPQVAERLGVRRAWLQDGDGPMRPDGGRPNPASRNSDVLSLHPDEVRLITRYRLLGEKERVALETLLAAIARPVPASTTGE